MKELELKELIPYFSYLFDEINWDYSLLSSEEKKVLSEESFNKIKELKFNISNNLIDEILKCKNNPYYFATNYLKVIDNDYNQIPYTTNLSEKEFNKFFV